MKATQLRARLMRTSMIAGALVASLATSAAYAQTTDDQADRTGEDDRAEGQTDQSTGGVAEILVTAQRRVENLQRVPVAVTAISSEELQTLRVVSVRSIGGLAPNLQFNTQGQQSNPTIIIRGVSSGTSSNAVDPAVGMYVDGVYLGRAVGSLLDFSDIEQIEVLRGPQGTLFGRNATAGAINITTAAPTGELGVKGNIAYGNYDALRAQATIDLRQFGPFSVRLSYLHDRIDGDVFNSIGGQTLNASLRAPEFGTLEFVDTLGYRKVNGGQLALRGDFGNLTADYRFDYTDTRASGRAMQSFGVIPDGAGQLLAPIIALQPFFGGALNQDLTGPLKTVANATSEEHTVSQGHSLILNLEASDSVSLKSITAFRRFRQDPVIFDLGSAGGLRFTFGQLGAFLTPGLTPAQIQAALFNPANRPGPTDYFFPLLTARATSQRQFSQELQVQITTDQLDVTAGVFYFTENSPGTEVLGILSPTPRGTIVPSPLDAVFGSGLTRTVAVNDSMAAYAQATWHVTDTFDITGGIRGTIDDRELQISAISGAQGGTLGVGTFKDTFRRLTYTGIATWRPEENSTLYAKIATGYVAGGILSGIPFRPEDLTSYELGAKTQLLNNRVRLNLAAFYNDYQDLQTQNFIAGQQFFDNAGKATIQGFEAEIDVVPTEGLTLSGNVGYADFEFETFILNGEEVAPFARRPYFSNWTGRVAASYVSPQAVMGGNLTALVEGRYRSSFFLTSTPLRDIRTGQPALEEFNRQPAYWLVNARLGLADLDVGGSRLSISAFGDNLFDERFVAFGAPVLLFTGMYERGRTYGVELGFAF